MKQYRVFLISLLSLFLTFPAYALKVDSIYQASVPVVSQATEVKLKAEQQALAEVLAKVSGNSNVLTNPTIKSSLSKADSLVQEFGYASSPTTPQTPYLLQVRFDSESINRLLERAGVATWGQNRPLILIWLEYEEPNRPAVIIESDSPHLIKSLLNQRAEQHGLPIVLPIMDMTDLNQVNVNDIVTMTLPPLQAASKRYGSDGMLLVRLFKLQSGFSIQSKLVMGNNQWDWKANGKNFDEVISALLNNVANTLAGRYSAVVSDNVQSQINLKVTNVAQDGDLEQLMQYVTHLAPVADAEPLHITGSEVLLKISLRGSKQSLIQALSMGQKLQPGSGSTDDTLVYQWNP